MPKEKSEAVNRRRTDNTMVKRKRTNNYLQNITLKTKDQATRTPLNTKSKDRQYNGQKKKDKQLSTKHYTEN